MKKKIFFKKKLYHGVRLRVEIFAINYDFWVVWHYSSSQWTVNLFPSLSKFLTFIQKLFLPLNPFQKHENCDIKIKEMKIQFNYFKSKSSWKDTLKLSFLNLIFFRFIQFWRRFTYWCRWMSYHIKYKRSTIS